MARKPQFLQTTVTHATRATNNLYALQKSCDCPIIITSSGIVAHFAGSAGEFGGPKCILPR